MRSLVLAALLFAAPSFAHERRVTFEVQRADLHGMLRVLAEVMKVNVVVGEDVRGQVTVRLKNVTAKDAFQVILDSHGLGVEKTGPNIWRVAPLSQLAAEASARAKIKDLKHQTAQLETTLMPVSYANAADLVPHVKAMLSDRGSVAVDARTNTLIIRDVRE
jgi:type II secretory pathway component HofQ